MRCPFCAHENSQVKDSRPTEDGSSIRRRRQCEDCGARFTTFERIQLRELTVLKSGDRREPFDRVKIGRVVRDLYLTAWGGRLFMFENFNGTPLQTLLSLTMKRAEFTGSGPFAEFARKVVGIEVKKDQMTEYKTVADYAKAQDSARGPKPAIQAAE